MFLKLLQKIFQPIIKTVQKIVNVIQTAVQNPKGQQITVQQPSTGPAAPSQPVPVSASASPDPVRQRELNNKARAFDKDIAQTSSALGEWDRSPVSLRDLSEEIDNPMYRAIKRRAKYQPELFNAMLKASSSPEKAFNAMFAKWGHDREMDARALAMWAR